MQDTADPSEPVIPEPVRLVLEHGGFRGLDDPRKPDKTKSYDIVDSGHIIVEDMRLESYDGEPKPFDSYSGKAPGKKGRRPE